MDDVKNKVDKDDVENVVKEDTPTKPNTGMSDVFYNIGKLAGFMEERSISEKDIKKAKITGMFMGAGIATIGYIFGISLTTILSNKHRN